MKRGSRLNRLCDRYLGIPALYMMSLIRRRRRMPEFGRIAIMSAPTLGDTLLTSAVVRDIRRKYPQASITYIASRTSVAAVRLLPAVDDVLEISLTRPWETIRKIRAGSFDLFLDLTPWQRVTAFYSAVSGARYVAGFRSLRQYRHWNYDVVGEHLRTRHEIDNYRALISVVGIQPGSSPRLRVGEAQPEMAVQNPRRILFHAWPSGDLAERKVWPEERWVELARRFKRGPVRFTVTGGPGDVAACIRFKNSLVRAGLDAETACGASSLEGLAEMLKAASLMVSVNTGILHLAAILGVPTVGLNGPTATHRWGPIGPRSTSVVPIDGGGFLHFGFEYAGNPTDSMSRIEVDEVYKAALRVAPALAEAAYPALPRELVTVDSQML